MTAPDSPKRFDGLMRESSRRLDLQGFRTFLLRGNVVDLAVGIVIGAAFTAVVTAFVGDFLTPLVSIPLGRAGDFGSRYWALGGARFGYGDFLNKLISLLLVGLAVYYGVVRPVNRLMERFRTETDTASPTKTCPECRSSIPVEATRCAFCTVALTAA